MATQPTVSGHPSLLDVAMTFGGKDGKPYKVANLLSVTNEVIPHFPFLPTNEELTMKGMAQTGLPAVTLGRYYKGVKVSKGGWTPVEDACAMAKGRAEIDKDLAELSGNTREYRRKRNIGFVEAMNQKFAQQLIYGSGGGDDVLGLALRYNDKSSISGARNILDAGGTGIDNTSIYLVVAGEYSVHGIYPKSSKAGLSHQDLGEIDAFDDDGLPYRAYAELWDWKFGLHVLDFRYIVRIANVDVSDLMDLTGTQALTAPTSLLKLMVRTFAKIPAMGVGRPMFLANRSVKEMLSVMALEKNQNVLAFTQALNHFGTVAPGSVAGTQGEIRGGQLTFMGVPVLTMDGILDTEDPVV